jgi:hypothetical protein
MKSTQGLKTHIRDYVTMKHKCIQVGSIKIDLATNSSQENGLTIYALTVL